MPRLIFKSKTVVAAIFAVFAFPLSGFAEESKLDLLFRDLAVASESEWQSIEEDIWAEWSKSGSDSMDFLLERGRRAMRDEDWKAAIDHLTALTDHAPDFAEGWNARATAFFRAGYLGESIVDIQRTLALNPRHFGALSGLGMILEELGRPEDALEAFRAANELHPMRPDVNDAIERLETEVQDTEI